MKRIKIKLLIIFLLFGIVSHAQTELRQTIKGVVTDADSKKLLASANVILVGSANGAITDSTLCIYAARAFIARLPGADD